jgi:D-3-phosphoglycerate dehydrogenase
MVAKKMAGFEMRFIAFDPFIDEETMSALGVEKVELDRLLTESDFISVHCPLMPKTRHLIGEEALKKMKPTVVLINTSRGPVVDEDALVRALGEGRISAFGADVLESEPPAADNPLLQMDNVVLTPHISPYSDIYYDSMWRYSVETALDLFNRRWPQSYVNPNVKPRWKMS